jgi:FkbM family methyltransferase
MKLLQGIIDGVKFYYRDGTSDIKTFNEVIGKNVYEKRGNSIKRGEKWYDCGGNVGAFTLLAISKGASEVEIYEPDPFNCDMIDRNLSLNGFKSRAKLHQKALVHDDRKESTLFVGNNGNYWRNSLAKNWNGKGLKVECVKFNDAVWDSSASIKMDIEGLEMPIIEHMNKAYQKLIFEWSFDIDPNLIRFWNVLDRLKLNYDVHATEYRDKGVTIYPKTWFPLCTNVFCYAKN